MGLGKRLESTFERRMRNMLEIASFTLIMNVASGQMCRRNASTTIGGFRKDEAYKCRIKK